MYDKEGNDQEEIFRVTPIVSLMLEQSQFDSANNLLNSFSELDLSLTYPEFGIAKDDLVATDCIGVNSVELLRFFDKIIVRLDPLPSKEAFTKTYFMTPDQMAMLARSGHFCVLRTARTIHYEDFYEPIFKGRHVPQNDRLVIVAAIAKAGGDPNRNPLREIETRVQTLGNGVWAGAAVRESFMGNIKRLYVFGFENIAEELLKCPSFPTAESLAFYLANYLCRPYTDAIGRFSCESGRRLTELRRRLDSHTEIDLTGWNPDIVFRKIADGDAPINFSDLRPGMTFTGPTFQVELAASEMWELLNGMILPMQTGVSINSRRVIGDPLAAADEVLNYPHRRECGRYLQETGHSNERGRSKWS